MNEEPLIKSTGANPLLRPREQVEALLRHSILTGELEAGSSLPTESELARDLGVGRSTLREALGALASAGFVHRVPGARGGTFVNHVDHRTLGTTIHDAIGSLLTAGRVEAHEVAAVRLLLEVPSARLAASNRSADDVASLRSIIDAQRTSTVENPEVHRLDMEFHTLIAVASGNRVLAALVASLHLETHPVRFLDLTPEVGRETVRQHLSIVDAIETGSPDDAAQAMNDHLIYVGSHAHSGLTPSSPISPPH